MKNIFIRGSVVRYVHLPHNAVDVTLLEDATRRGQLDVSFQFHLLLLLSFWLMVGSRGLLMLQ